MSATSHVGQWIDRCGGMLVAPRRTVAALDGDLGRRDGMWALFAWMLGLHVFDAFQVAARIGALRSFDAVFAGVAELAIGLLPPFVATFAIELTLGSGRSHRAGTCLAPMLAVGTVLHLVAAAGLVKWSPGWLPDALAGVAAIAIAVYVKPAVPAVAKETA